ncbi:MAG: hypothetical protein JST54_25225 [Deltaproteobacteria bacterium]|nr:hypothetical protein [Deltaproteobacteria bacterium]
MILVGILAHALLAAPVTQAPASIDPCSLLTQKEAADAFGTPVKPARHFSVPSSGDQCFYESTKSKSYFISVTVQRFTGSGRTVETWKRLYERLTARGDAERIANLGDAAYYARQRDFLVAKGDWEVQINAILSEASYDFSPNSDKTAEKKAARAAAEHVLARL